MRMYSEKDIEELRFDAAYFALDCPDEFFSLPAAELAAVCNGVGPGRWHKFARWILTRIAGEYAVTAAIHDLQHELALQGNKECAKIFLHNALKIHAATYGSIVEKLFIYLAFGALKFFGGKYWRKKV